MKPRITQVVMRDFTLYIKELCQAKIHRLIG